MDQEIYINEHLTLENLQIFLEAKKKGKENNSKFIWTKDCKIFMRKSEKSKTKIIKNKKDIEDIFKVYRNTCENEEVTMSDTDIDETFHD